MEKKKKQAEDSSARVVVQNLRTCAASRRVHSEDSNWIKALQRAGQCWLPAKCGFGSQIKTAVEKQPLSNTSDSQVSHSELSKWRMAEKI